MNGLNTSYSVDGRDKNRLRHAAAINNVFFRYISCHLFVVYVFLSLSYAYTAIYISMFIYRSIYLSIYLSLDLYLFLSIYLSFYLTFFCLSPSLPLSPIHSIKISLSSHNDYGKLKRMGIISDV